MQTQEAILERIKERRAIDFFGFEWECYAAALTFDNVKQFLKPDSRANSKTWGNDSTDEQIKEAMIFYMRRAWEAAHNKAGLSAMRTISRYVAWTWLIGDTELSKRIEREATGYGVNALTFICEHYGWNIKEFADN